MLNNIIVKNTKMLKIIELNTSENETVIQDFINVC